MNESVTKFCEICQIKLEGNVIFHSVDNDCKLKLLDFLPENDLHLTQNSFICNQCIIQITDVPELKRLQVKDEGNVDELPQHNVAFNFKESVASFEKDTICVKEEPGCEKNCNMLELKQLKIKNEGNFNTDSTTCVTEEPGVEKMKEEFNVGLIKDEICDLQIKDEFFAEVNNEKLIEMYYCHDCGRCADTKQKLIQHIYKQHRKKRDVGKDLMRKPTIEKIYQCDKCNYMCCYKSRFITHISKHTGEKPYQCDKCDYKFAQKSNLKTHMLSKHTDEKPYQCDKCDYKSSNKRYLKMHTLSQHTCEKPYQCDKCSYKCGRKNHFKLHMLSQHTGEKPYQCDKCNYKCVSKSYLKRHTLSQHTGEKPYQCDKCDYKSCYKSSLKRHTLSQHAGLKPYHCDNCDYKSSYKSSLKRHTLSQHTGENHMNVVSA